MQNSKSLHIYDGREMYEPLRNPQFTDAVQTVNSDGFKGTPHHWMFLQHLVKAVHAERVQTTICICTDAGCPPSTSQQTDLCMREETNERRRKEENESEKGCEINLSDII